MGMDDGHVDEKYSTGALFTVVAGLTFVIGCIGVWLGWI